MNKHLVWLFALLTLTGCKEQPVPEAVIRPAQIWQVGTAIDSRGASYSGEIRARYEADLAFRVSGKVKQRLVNLGDHVKAGEVLARLDTDDLRLGLASARAALSAAEADYKNARAELTRLKDLFERQFIGRSQLDSAQAAHDAALARVRSSRAQADISSNQAGYSELTADRDGIVTQLNVEAGQVISAGAPAFHIAYDGEREVLLRVGENTVNTLQTGTPVVVTLWSGNTPPLQGRVRELSPATDANRSFLVKVSLLQPPADLRLGVTADVSLPLSRNGTADWIPATALFQQGDKPAVWRLDSNNSVQLSPVEIVSFHEAGVVIKGVDKGSRIIAAGIHKIFAGQTVKPVPYDGKAGS